MLGRARIGPGKEARLRDWFDELGEREGEVVETLRHEGVYTESAFVLSTDHGSYLYVYMEADDLRRAVEAGEEESYEIDERHHDVLDECLATGWERLDAIGHFTNPDLR